MRGRELSLGRIVDQSADWKTYTASALDGSSAATQQPRNVSGAHGTGAIVVTGAKFVSDDDRELHILEHGVTASLDIDYAISDPHLNGAVRWSLPCTRTASTTRAGISHATLSSMRPASAGTIRLTFPG